MASNGLIVVADSPPRLANGDGDAQRVIVPASAAQTPMVVRNLEQALRMNQQRYETLEGYYRGQHPHTFSSARFLQAFGSQLRRFADNWMRLVVTSTAARLRVQGFRVGEEDVDGTSEIDQRAWEIWKANRMGQGELIAYRDAMKFGTSFLMIDPTVDGTPKITVESPFQVIGERDPLNRYRLINAIKKWIGSDGFQYLNYYTPEVVLKFQAVAISPGIGSADPGRILQQPSWAQIGEVENPLGEVPVVPIENQPDLLTGGTSDLDDLIPLNDGLNKVMRDALVASEYQSFRQRYVVGVDVPKGEDGRPLTENVAQLTASERRVWMFPSAETKLGEFGQVDLNPFVQMIEMFIHHISMVSQTPAYMLVGKMANLSADAIRAAELGFVGKLQSKQEDFGVGHEEGMRLALKADGSDPGDQPIEPIWKDAQANSGSILSNELTQMGNLGVPLSVLFEKWGATPQEVERWMKLRKDPAQQAPSGSTGGVGAAGVAERGLTDGNSAPDG